MKIMQITRQNSRFKVIAVIVLGVVTLVGVGGYLVIRANSKPTNTNPLPITREQAIPKAQEYLGHDLNNMDPTLRLMLDFLYRKFGINNTFSGKVSPINTSNTDPIVQAELKAIARIAYTDSLVNDLGPNPTYVAIGANCDHIPMPTNISGLLQQEIDKGSYELTHAFLSMQLMKELDCPVNNIEALRQQAITGMVTMAGDDKTENDLRFESMAFLMYGGKLDSIDPKWIDKIYDTQHQDGGWSLDLKDPRSDPHTSVLALWALLEYTHPAVPYEPIVHNQAN